MTDEVIDQQTEVSPFAKSTESTQSEKQVSETPSEASSNDPSDGKSQEENIFNSLDEEDAQIDKVPIKVFQDRIAKEKHKRVQAHEEANKLRQENAWLLQQLQTGQAQGTEYANNVAQKNQNLGFTTEQMIEQIELQASKKANERQMLEIVNPALKKHDDFSTIVADLPWQEGMVLATRALPDAGEFIYQLSKFSDKGKEEPGYLVNQISSLPTAEERGAMLANLMNQWKANRSSNSQHKKVLSSSGPPPTQIIGSSPGVAKIDESSLEAALARTMRLRGRKK